MDIFAKAGERGLKVNSEDETTIREKEIKELRAKVGELVLEQMRLSTSPSHSAPSVLMPSAKQAPAPSQNSRSSHGPEMSRHSVAVLSNWQDDEQQSPSRVLPSSHCSPGSAKPSAEDEARFERYETALKRLKQMA